MRCGALAVFLVVLPAAAGAESDAAGEGADLAQAVASAHELADRMAMTDPAAGARELEAVLDTPFPPGQASREMRSELFAHTSELYLAAHEPAKALVSARRGLAEEKEHEPGRFTALLWLREGEALEASGDERAAVKSYSRAIELARRLLAGSSPRERAK